MKKPFYCISYYDGSVSWVELLPKDQYILYAKSPLNNPHISNVHSRPNVGYNIDSYLTFIIDCYENLPELVIFCKNNVVGRHVSSEVFEHACASKVFTPIEDSSYWDRLKFPTSVVANDGGYLEFNNSWYSNKYPLRYFSNYNDFYKFIFDVSVIPVYLRFAPGANYVVPRENILIRSRQFYINLRKLIAHATNSCEAHYVERTLVAIWSSTLKDGEMMRRELGDVELLELERIYNMQLKSKNITMQRIKNYLFNYTSSSIFSALFSKNSN